MKWVVVILMLVAAARPGVAATIDFDDLGVGTGGSVTRTLAVDGLALADGAGPSVDFGTSRSVPNGLGGATTPTDPARLNSAASLW
jgi:hypothetical protein